MIFIVSACATYVCREYVIVQYTVCSSNDEELDNGMIGQMRKTPEEREAHRTFRGIHSLSPLYENCSEPMDDFPRSLMRPRRRMTETIDLKRKPDDLIVGVGRQSRPAAKPSAESRRTAKLTGHLIA